MKKTLVSALTTALVVGAASTTFAAANPFADVPADHWAYDAVSQLAQDGVVNGYAIDGTFKGDQAMSRYEMAQIVAKAIARGDAADANNKALIDKLAAEFSDELANLGVRVADLEAKSDNVIWAGLIRYDWNTTNFEQNRDHKHQDTNRIKLRLEPTFVINENWTGHARMDYDLNNATDVAGNNDNKVEVDRINVVGDYGKTKITLGRFGTFSDASHGLVMDDKVTGIEVAYAPTSDWKLKATAGQVAANPLFGQNGTVSTVVAAGDPLVPTVKTAAVNNTARYAALEADYSNGKWDAGIGYRQYGSTKMNTDFYSDKSTVGVFDLGVGYHFNDTVYGQIDYAVAPGYDSNSVAEDRSTPSNAYNIQISYKGAKASDKGSWGAYLAYRQMAPYAAMFATQDNIEGAAGVKSLKGWELGVSYTFAKNIVGTVKYFDGKDQFTDKTLSDKAKAYWARVDFMF